LLFCRGTFDVFANHPHPNPLPRVRWERWTGIASRRRSSRPSRPVTTFVSSGGRIDSSASRWVSAGRVRVPRRSGFQPVAQQFVRRQVFGANSRAFAARAPERIRGRPPAEGGARTRQSTSGPPSKAVETDARSPTAATSRRLGGTPAPRFGAVARRPAADQLRRPRSPAGVPRRDGPAPVRERRSSTGAQSASAPPANVFPDHP